MKHNELVPVDEATRAWLNYRWQWLCQEFGTQKLKKRVVVLPSDEFFPDAFTSTPEAIDRLVSKVAEYMEVDFNQLEIRFYEEARNEFQGSHQSTAGMYSKNENGKCEIWLEISQFNDAVQTIATIAHELSHVLLLGQNRIKQEADDHEQLTDLVTVFMGLGIFPANSSIKENYWQEGYTSGWSIGKQGYLSMNMFGYAFALFALSREEENPPWLKHLRLDVRNACMQSMKYLRSVDEPPTRSLIPVPFPELLKSSKTERETGKDEDAETSDEPRCVYCSEPVVKFDESDITVNICVECRESMREADNELEVEIAKAPQRERRERTFGIFFLVIIILAVLFAILQS